MSCLGCGGPTKLPRAKRCLPCHKAHLSGEPAQGPTGTPVSTADAVASDLQAQRQKRDDATLQKRYDEALRTIERLERSLEAKSALDNVRDTIEIEPRHASGTGEATVCATASDWHIEELVGSEVGDLNRYTPEIAEASAKTFFQGVLRLTQLLSKDIKIKQMILSLLGDFITNDIHDAENAELNALLPMHAITRVQRFIIAGLEFLLKHTDIAINVPCHSGNHARTTHKTRFGAENGHSLEYLMYIHLADHFRHEPRLTFVIPDGMHSYATVYDQTIRFHHGHGIKYGGGVGGIYIPTNKAIAQWNKGRRADLDVFGHFHQMRDGGNFICNGSMIGYNSFALSIKADYEQPKQALFLLDKKRGRTCTWPILFDDRTTKHVRVA